MQTLIKKETSTFTIQNVSIKFLNELIVNGDLKHLQYKMFLLNNHSFIFKFL